MKEGFEPRPFPAGLHKERPQYPTMELKNTVLWENEDLRAPFKFEVGAPSPLGLTFDLSEDDAVKSRGLSLRTREDAHGRSADIGAVYFKDPEGHLYRDIDLKGVGAVSKGTGVPYQWRTETAGGILGAYIGTKQLSGLMNKEDALHDTEIAETFTHLDIRTHRTVAIVELEELAVYDEDKPAEGMKTEPIQDLRESGKLPEVFIPVVQVRAFGTKTRLQDIHYDTHAKKELEDAISFVSHETDGKVADISSYASWFTETLAVNVSRMHKNGYTHGYLTSHNITADCRLTDFDSVEKRPAEDLDPVAPIFSSPEEELNAEPQKSAFWDAASEDFHRTIKTLQGFLVLLMQRFPDETESVDPEKLLATFEKVYLRENPSANYLLRGF